MIELKNLNKVFETAGGDVHAVRDVSLTVQTGDICVLLGPSGCGKTTTLKMINRLIPKTSGEIWIEGEDTDQLDAVSLRRKIGYVIQQVGLFPNMTIEDNVCSVPDLLGWDRTKSRRKAHELLDLVNLDPSIFAKRFPKELSGGQQQRAGVARALAAEPTLMLMDEPFGAIDPINREEIQDEFLKLQKQLGTTVIFVSHDLDEAIKMGNQIAIFNDGQLVQSAAPNNLLAHPANDFIRDFLGGERTLRRLALFTVADVMGPAQGAAAGAQSGMTVSTTDNLRVAMNKMLDQGLGQIDVVNQSQFVGTLSQAAITEYLARGAGAGQNPAKGAGE